MMQLVINQHYGTLDIDFYLNKAKDIFVTIDQLAKGFGYKNRNGIEKMMERQQYLKEERFSTTDKLSVVEGDRTVLREVRLFNKRGITEIGMLSRTEQGTTFRQWIFDHIEQLEKQNYEFQLQRALEQPLRRNLTDAVKTWKHANGWSYSLITNLLFKTVTGKNAKQLKDSRGLASSSALDLLTADELKHYQGAEHYCISLIELGCPYEDIKKRIGVR